jgi:STE24 endopeptidase
MGNQEVSSKYPSEWPAAWKTHDAKIKPYLWRHRLLGLAGNAVGLTFLLYLLLTKNGLYLEAFLVQRLGAGYLLWLAYFGTLGLVWRFLSLPFSLGHHLVERRYELSKQRFGPWLWDVIKTTLVGAVFGAIALGLVYLSVKHFPDEWWLLCCTLLVFFSIVLAQLTPVLLIPLFFKLKPMEPGTLKDRLLALCSKFKVEVKDVYHLGLGEKTEKGNAAFLGIGRTKRIVIGDTLYEKFPAEEVEAVFAHELGHQVHNDLWKGIFLGAALMYLAFFLTQAIVTRWVWPWFGEGLGSAFGLLIFFVVMSLVQWPMGVLQAMFSRSLERAADRFASETIKMNQPLADALEKLTLQNYSLFRPNPVIEYLTYSHPASWRRILTLRKGMSERSISA